MYVYMHRSRITHIQQCHAVLLSSRMLLKIKLMSHKTVDINAKNRISFLCICIFMYNLTYIEFMFALRDLYTEQSDPDNRRQLIKIDRAILIESRFLLGKKYYFLNIYCLEIYKMKKFYNLLEYQVYP